ncbi:hypothetical protein CRENBAI_023508 [Crenichthys baileyi]|uniref:Uncharacterized protein n=1 Tax=Crenichthys baileyi TaxID=28760 RepID=A0AAV9S2X7_9TELE
MNRIRHARETQEGDVWPAWRRCLQSLHFTEGVLVPACGFWLIGFELFVFKCIWKPALPMAYSSRDASSAWLKRELAAALPAANDSVSYSTRTRNSEEVGPKPTEMDNDPCLFCQSQKSDTRIYIERHILCGQKKRHRPSKVLSLEKLKWTRKE